MSTKEIWKPMKGYEGLYEISTLARIRSLDRKALDKNGHKIVIKGRMMKPYVNENGYVVIRLSKKGVSKIKRVHRLMMKTFTEEIPGKPVVNHKDGNKLNNFLDNLEWATSSENNIHAIKTGLRSYDKIKCEYHITIDDLDFVVAGAKEAAKRLHEAGYFTEIDTYNLKAGITRCAIKHQLYLGVLKAEKTDDPFDISEAKPYSICGIKGKQIRARLPSGLTVKAMGPAKLVDKMREIGFWKEDSRKKMVAQVSDAARNGYKCRGIKVWYL